MRKRFADSKMKKQLEHMKNLLIHLKIQEAAMLWEKLGLKLAHLMQETGRKIRQTKESFINQPQNLQI